MGARAETAGPLLFGVDFTPDLRILAADRADVELVSLERLYGES
jgi:hypothetical protein